MNEKKKRKGREGGKEDREEGKKEQETKLELRKANCIEMKLEAR